MTMFCSLCRGWRRICSYSCTAVIDILHAVHSLLKVSLTSHWLNSTYWTQPDCNDLTSCEKHALAVNVRSVFRVQLSSVHSIWCDLNEILVHHDASFIDGDRLKRIDKIQGDAENICSQSVLFLKKKYHIFHKRMQWHV